MLIETVSSMDRPGSIHVTLSEKDKTVQLAVSDTGKGIAPEHLTKVFNRFYRVGSKKQTVDVFGLGLAIAKWIVHEEKK